VDVEPEVNVERHNLLSDHDVCSMVSLDEVLGEKMRYSWVHEAFKTLWQIQCVTAYRNCTARGTWHVRVFLEQSALLFPKSDCLGLTHCQDLPSPMLATMRNCQSHRRIAEMKLRSLYNKIDLNREAAERTPSGHASLGHVYKTVHTVCGYMPSPIEQFNGGGLETYDQAEVIFGKLCLGHYVDKRKRAV
jgi:hypothetical protein